MKSFTDTKGQVWELTINFGQIKRVRGLLEVNLHGLFDDQAKPLAKLLDDPFTLMNVLYVLLKDQAEKLNISDEQFPYLFDGETFHAAADCLVEELIDFFHDRQGRQALRKLIEKSKELSHLTLQNIESEIDNIDLASLTKKSKNSSTVAPVSAV